MTRFFVSDVAARLKPCPDENQMQRLPVSESGRYKGGDDKSEIQSGRDTSRLSVNGRGRYIFKSGSGRARYARGCRRLEYFTIRWNTLGIVAILAGAVAGGVSLDGGGTRQTKVDKNVPPFRKSKGWDIRQTKS